LLALEGFCSAPWRWIALPRRGQVRSFLKSDEAQAYFTVAIIVLVAFGGVNLFRGIWLISE
jgi:hypothetical protein